jgi:hypothetical protein
MYYTAAPYSSGMANTRAQYSGLSVQLAFGIYYVVVVYE